MLNFLHDPIPITLSYVFTLVTDKKRRYHVTDDEQSLVLKTYEELNGHWEKNGRVHERQHDEDTWRLYEKVQNERVQQLRRIVTTNGKKIATGTPVNPPLRQATPPSTAT